MKTASRTRVRHILLGEAGGEDRISTGLATHPSRPIFTQNFERLVTGGFQRIAGYQKWDGQEVAGDPPPGSGALLGGVVFNGKIYVLRNDTVAKLYVSSASGWALVHAFGAAGVRAEFTVENFLGTAAGICLYGCDGGNQAWQMETDETVTLITSGATTDTPSHLAAHRARLWLGFDDGAVRYSPVGDPGGSWADSWTSGVIGIGRPVSGLRSLVGGVLAIFGEDRTYLLYGASGSDFDLREHGKDIGARAYSPQDVGGRMFFLDTAGITDLGSTDQFGDFLTNKLSLDIKPDLDVLLGSETASLALTNKAQYRIFFDDGSGKSPFFIGTVLPNRVDWCRGRYDVTVSCAWSGVLAGQEVAFIGTDTGDVYRIDAGTSFDGAPYTSVYVSAFDNQGEPLSYKTYRKVVLEVDVVEEVDIHYQAHFDYDASGVPKGLALSSTVLPDGTRWGTSGTWGSFTWGGTSQGVGHGYLAGWGKSVSVVLSVVSDTVEPLVLRTISYLYEPRRYER